LSSGGKVCHIESWLRMRFAAVDIEIPMPRAMQGIGSGEVVSEYKKQVGETWVQKRSWKHTE